MCVCGCKGCSYRSCNRCDGGHDGCRHWGEHRSRHRGRNSSHGHRRSRSGGLRLGRHSSRRWRNRCGQRTRGHTWMRRHGVARRHHGLTGIGLPWVRLRIARRITHRHLLWILALHGLRVARWITHRHLLRILALHRLGIARRIAHWHLLRIPLRRIARRRRHKSRCIARQRLGRSWRRSNRWRVLGSWR